MKLTFAIAALAAVISTSATAQTDLKVTAAGENTFRTGTQTARHLWVDLETKSVDFSVFAFGWTSAKPEYWVEGWAKQPFLKRGAVSLTPGAFGSWQMGRNPNYGPAITLSVGNGGWNFTSFNYWIMENGQAPSFFIPNMRLQAPQQGAFRYGVEASYFHQGSVDQLRLGPTVSVKVGANATLRASYLKGTRGEDDQLRTFISFRF